MKKIAYQAPEVEVVKMVHQTPLLEGSINGGNNAGGSGDFDPETDDPNI
ncbi:MAG: hypothetical protein IJ588_02205 [Prevotella sp.]|nr:hypothetical protein [Prevotella sp.]